MELSQATRVRTDVAVIGSGLAGLIAAITAHDEGRSVVIVAQGEIGRASNSWLASGGHGSWSGFKHRLMAELGVPSNEFHRWDVPQAWIDAYKKAHGR